MQRRTISLAPFAVGLTLALVISACSGSDDAGTTNASAVASTAVSATTPTANPTATPTTNPTAVNSDTAASEGTSGGAAQHAFEAEHFAAGAIVGDVVSQECTLNGGTVTTCAKVTIAGSPASYSAGPFCPTTITTPASDAGIWFDGNGLYDLDGPFIVNLPTLYGDENWKLYDSDGKVNVTDTKEAFEGAARPDVDPEYQNHCVEGRLEWLTGGVPIQTTVEIPLQPVKAATVSSDHPGNLGISLDGVVIAESAPVEAILGAYTIAAFDDCGGHYNPIAGYHMHGVMGCGEQQADTVTGETAMFGYAIDGYPIHLPLDDAALATANLDECNGHSNASEGYHYHANSAAKNAILPCLTGEYVADANAGGPPAGGPPAGGGAPGGTPPGAPDFTTAAAKLGVTTHELEDAMVDGPNTDLTAAADVLGVTRDDLQAALGNKPG